MRISPDNWDMGPFFLTGSGTRRMQLDLSCGYRKNVELHLAWQTRLHEERPKTQIFWGRGEIFCTPKGGEAYLRDLLIAKLVRLESAHFAAGDCIEEITTGSIGFYDSEVAK